MCHALFTTHEKIDLASFYSVSSGKKLVAFNPAKLLLSLLDVLAYTGHSPEDAYWLSETIQTTLINQQTRDPIIRRADIAKTSYEVLVAYDELAGRAYTAKHQL